MAEGNGQQRARPRGTKDTFSCPHCKDAITLVGTREAVRLLGTNTSSWQSWRERKDFPEPLWDAGQGALWRKEDLLEWDKQRRAGKTEKVLSEAVEVLAGLDPESRQRELEKLIEAARGGSGAS